MNDFRVRVRQSFSQYQQQQQQLATYSSSSTQHHQHQQVSPVKFFDGFEPEEFDKQRYESEIKQLTFDKEFLQGQLKEALSQIDKLTEYIKQTEVIHSEKMFAKKEEILIQEQCISKLQNQLNEFQSQQKQLNEELNQKIDQILKLEGIIDVKDNLLEECRAEIYSIKEKLLSKEEVIEALSNTLSKKINEHVKLEQRIEDIKSSFVEEEDPFGQKFIVFKINKKGKRKQQAFCFIRDILQSSQYFLSITQKDGSKKENIPIMNIENIDVEDELRFSIIFINAKLQQTQHSEEDKQKSNSSKLFKMTSYFTKKNYCNGEVIKYESENLKKILEFYQRVRLRAMEDDPTIILSRSGSINKQI